MRILYLDCDTLRPDHLGCYGYTRDTSPNIDAVAREGVRFDNCYVSDAPCLPSRSSLFTGRFGIHTGVVNHGGEAADPYVAGYPTRLFRMGDNRLSWMGQMRRAGFHTVSVSPYAERHSAWWFYEGFSEMFNTGRTGNERADEINPVALDWITRNAKHDNWFLHVNYWDPHRVYRTPMEYGNPFEGQPVPAWYTEEIRRKHWESFGPRSAQDATGLPPKAGSPREPLNIASLDDWRRWIDGYDTGIRYMDDHIGRLFDALRKAGVFDDLVIIMSVDHGENQGELNVYGDHHTADHVTSRVPLIIRWPGVATPRVDAGLIYQTDMSATVTELAGGKCSPDWDGRSFAEAFRAGESLPREHLVVGQCCWSVQRSVRWDDFMCLRTYHDGLHDWPELMLFDVKTDPHETQDLAGTRPDLVGRAMRLLDDWQGDMMSRSETGVDPLHTVLREGGPFHTRTMLEPYCAVLRKTGRAHHADALASRPEGTRGPGGKARHGKR